MLVRREPETREGHLHQLPQTLRKGEAEAHPALQRGRRAVEQPSEHQQHQRFQQCGANRERHPKHHFGGDGEARRHPHRHHQPHRKSRQCFRSPFSLQNQVRTADRGGQAEHLEEQTGVARRRRLLPVGCPPRLLRRRDRQHRPQGGDGGGASRYSSHFGGDRGALPTREDRGRR